MKGDRPATLGRRLLFTLGLIIALFLIFSTLIFTTIQGAYRFLTLVQEDQQEIETVSKSAEGLYAAADNYLQSGKSEYERDYAQFLGRAQRSLTLLAKKMPGDLVYDIQDLSNMLRSFQELKAEAVERYHSGTDAIYINRLVSELGRMKGYIRGECSRILSEYMDLMNGQVMVMRSNLEWSERLSFTLLFVVTAICLILALSLTRDISRPVHSLVESLERFAAGDLDVQAPSRQRKDEIASLIASFNTMTVQIKNLVEEIHRKSNLETALKQSELETLQAWINPHFLFNTLNSISVLADLEGAAKTQATIGSLAELLRINLKSAGSTVPLHSEIASVEHYLRIQKVRFGNRLNYQILWKQEWGALLVPGMILQPFVENAVLHGLEPLENGGMVEVEAAFQDDLLLIEIRDNGTGFDVTETQQNIHAGTNNTVRRLELFYGKPVVRIESEPGKGTTVRLQLWVRSQALGD